MRYINYNHMIFKMENFVIIFGVFALSCCMCQGFKLGIGGPLHASCKINWTFSGTCEVIQESLVNQINKWKTDENCASGGEKCLYTLQSATATEIKAVHETPKKHYKDDQTFTLKPSQSVNDGCDVEGFSTSEIWYALLDQGTNYCNLHNLITGAGLDKLAGYTETTSNSQCTQYSSADCKKY